MDEQRWEEQPGRRRHRVAAVAGLVLLVVLGGLLARPAGPEATDDLPGLLDIDPAVPTPRVTPTPRAPSTPTATPTPVTAAFDPSSRWSVVQPGPVSTPVRGPGAWDGRRLVRWPGRGTGGVYAPDVDAWAALAPAPLVRERDWSATWTGKEVIFWGGLDGDGTATADGVALDTAAMTWRLVPGAPLVGRTGHAAAYGGGRLWVWGGVGADEGMRNDGAAFDPSAGTWQVLPAAPLSPRSHATMVWTGDGLLVWGGRGHADAGADTPTLVDGARYRPGEGWTRIADAPTAYAGAPAVLWTGASSCPNERACAKLLVWGTPAPGLHLRDGYLYDLATDTWSELPNLLSQTRRDAVALWTGEHAVVWGGVDWRGAPARRDGFIYEPVSERWVQIPRLPLDTEPGATVVLMGDALLVVGDAGGGRYPLREPIERLAASP